MNNPGSHSITSAIQKLFAPRNRIRQFTPAGLVFLCLVYGESVKLPLVEKLTTMRIGENEINFGLLAIKHDLAVFTWLAALFILSLMMREYIVSTAIRCIITLFTLVWAVDIFVLYFFTTRLSVSDILKFSSQWSAIRTFINQIFPDQKWLLVLIIVSILSLITLFIFTRVTPTKSKAIITLSVFPLILISVYKTDDPTSYVHSWTYQNVFEINMKQGITKQFSDNYIKYLKNTPNGLGERTSCIPGMRERPNVIVLLFESLSMYHSHTFSGLTSMVPNFDRIADKNIVYTNFFSNGHTTESALVSIFTGKHMLPPTSGYATASWDSAYFYRGFHEEEGSLPSLFDNNGYHTAFITTGDLDFLNKGDWLRNIGFDYVEGAEHSFYEGWPRLHFNAAPDEALYERTFQFLENLAERTPYLLTIETVSTHQPFYNPYNLKRDEASVFTMADEALGVFYDTLKIRNFFENGILIILGDHRSMTGLRQDELSLYGKSSASRVPMVVVYGDGRKSQKIDSFSQQTDFISSFEYLIGDQSCTGQLNGNFFSVPPIEADYILFPRGDDRNLIDIYSPKNAHETIRINGDNTAIISGTSGDKSGIIKHINKERLRISRTKEIGPQQ